MFDIGSPRPFDRTDSRSRGLVMMARCDTLTLELKSLNRSLSVTPSGRPLPSSSTEKWTRRAPASTSTVTTISVADEEEYLTAFVRPFMMIWRSRAPSVRI